MIEWEEKELESVLEALIDYRGKTPKKSQAGIPLVTAKVIKNGSILPTNEFLTTDEYKRWMTRGFPQIGDLVLTMEAPLGEVAIIKELPVALAQRTVAMRANDNNSTRFLKYFFQSSLGQHQLEIRASGTTVQGIKSSLLKKIPIPCPPLAEQEAIAEVLSSLDDKIDLLKRQNKTLEGMAEALFRQRFIEEAQDDWEEVELGDLIEIRNGKDHKHLADGDIPVYGSGGLMRKADGFLFDGESILLPRKGTLNNVMVVNEAFWTVDTMFYTEMKRPYLIKFVFHHLKRMDLALMNVGSAVPSMTKTAYSHIPILMPAEPKLEAFEIEASHYYDKVRSNNESIQNLRTQRDTLLPKLMSGEVRVQNTRIDE